MHESVNTEYGSVGGIEVIYVTVCRGRQRIINHAQAKKSQFPKVLGEMTHVSRFATLENI